MHNLSFIIKEAEKAANDTNHKRNGRSYFDAHIYPVMVIGEMYMSFIPQEDRDIVRAALALHDSIEDHRLTSNNILEITNSKEVRDIVYAVTNEKGHTRAERANEKYYEGIRNTKYACFVKLCDRIHNVADSKMSHSTMFEKYKNENSHFMASLECPEMDKYIVMKERLFNILHS